MCVLGRLGACCDAAAEVRNVMICPPRVAEAPAGVLEASAVSAASEASL